MNSKLSWWTIGFIAGLIFSYQASHADEIQIRYNNINHTPGIFNPEFSTSGKLIEVSYLWQPFEEVEPLLGNLFFIEGALGKYYAQDFDVPQSVVMEASPGIQVEGGFLKLRLSQGIARFPTIENYNANQYVTHISLSLVDDLTGAYIGLERSHYSTGNSSLPNTGLDLTGLVVGVHF